MKYFYEASEIQPNKVFFLHCREKVAKDRIRKKLYKIKTVTKAEEDIKMLDCKSNTFNAEKDKLLKYLESKPEVFHIDANRRLVTVLCEILEKFEKDRNAIGFSK